MRSGRLGRGAIAKWVYWSFVAAIAVGGAALYGQSEGLIRLGVVNLSAPASASPRGAAEIHYSPEEDLEAIDVAEIDRAEHTIDVFAYVLTDAAVIDALRDAGARGARVRIWRDAEMARKTSDIDVAARLAQGSEGVETRIKPEGELMHLKGYCVDGPVLRTGSANFSRSGETRQDNDLVLVRDPAACERFEAKFARAWGAP